MEIKEIDNALEIFRGFRFREGTSEYVNKLEYARRLTIGDLISCCNLLGLGYDGNKEELIIRICGGLIDLNSFVTLTIPRTKMKKTASREKKEVRTRMKKEEV